jgi:hypothetical protein
MSILLSPHVLSKTTFFGLTFLVTICLTEMFCFYLSLFQMRLSMTHTTSFSQVTRVFLALKKGCFKIIFGLIWKRKSPNMPPPSFAARLAAKQINLSHLS